MTRTNPRGLLVPLMLFCQLLLPFSTLPLQATEIRNSPDSSSENSAPTTSEQDGDKGIASYYADRYNGRKTNSGKRYDPEKLTAAHQDLPLGTRVRVVNLANQREVVVTVNDRCRRRKFPFIDLSKAAAKKLGFFGKGITKVRIIALDDEDEDEDEDEGS